MLPEFSPPGDWAQAIRDMTAERGAYEFMSDTGFDRARSRLSWEAWAERIEGLALEVVETRVSQNSGLKVAAAR